MRRQSTLDRFFKYVTPTDGCWNWRAFCDRKGYGHFYHKGRSRRAHRAAIELIYGIEIPPELEADHLCTNTSCVRPDHLEVVTGQINTLRGNTIPAANSRKTHCPNGHEYRLETTRFRRGKRYCRLCEAIHYAASEVRRRSAAQERLAAYAKEAQ